jgi:hypothetical protein
MSPVIYVLSLPQIHDLMNLENNDAIKNVIYKKGETTLDLLTLAENWVSLRKCASLWKEKSAVAVFSGLQTLNSAGEASLYLHRNGALERSSCGVLEPRWSNLLYGKSCS